MQSNFMRILVWGFLNLFLIASILFVLDYFNIWSVSELYNKYVKGDPAGKAKIEDPLLLDKDELAKRKANMDAREEIMTMRKRALEETQKKTDEAILLVKKWVDQLDQRENSFLAVKNEWKSEEKRIQEVAKQIQGMPPNEASKMLEGQDSLFVIRIFRQMDKNAQAANLASTVPFLLTLMEKKKSQEIMRLMGKLPGEEIQTSEPQEEQPVNEEPQPGTEEQPANQ